MITSAAMSVTELERMLVSVLVMIWRTPEMSLVMRVMMSPWLFVVKNDWLMRCRWRYICPRMSNVMCSAIQLFK